MDIWSDVFSNESIDKATFEERLAKMGKFKLLNEDEFSELGKAAVKNTELEKELFAVKNDGKIDLFLSQSRAKNIKAARAMIDESEIFDENGLNEDLLAECTQKMKSENPWLFESDEPMLKTVSTLLPRGHVTVKDPSRMSDEEFYKNMMKGENQ